MTQRSKINYIEQLVRGLISLNDFSRFVDLLFCLAIDQKEKI